MKKKLTSAEYQALPIQLKDRYTRYSGSDEVYYELIRTPLPEAQPLEVKKTAGQNVKEVEKKLPKTNSVYNYDKWPEIFGLSESTIFDIMEAAQQYNEAQQGEKDSKSYSDWVKMYCGIHRESPSGIKTRSFLACIRWLISIGAICEKSLHTAQFATDAGGGKEMPPAWYDEMSLTNYLQNKHYHKDIIIELVKDFADSLQQAFKKGWEKGYNDIQNNGTWDYVYYRPENTTTTPTHSSSEMVDNIKRLFMQWSHSYDPIGLHHSFITQYPISDDNIRITTSTHDYVVFDVAGTWFLASIIFVDGEPNEEWTKQFNSQKEAKDYAENILITQILTIK